MSCFLKPKNNDFRLRNKELTLVISIFNEQLVNNSQLFNFTEMNFIQKIFDFYLNSSLHVAIAATSFAVITSLISNLQINYYLILFIFLGTFSGYNILKYQSLFKINKHQKSSTKIIAILSIASIIVAFFLFLRFKVSTQLSVIFAGIILLIYALPIFYQTKNGRQQMFLKTNWVTMAWTIICTVAPVLENSSSFSLLNLIYSCQFYLHIFTTMLVFEIVDLKNDDKNLQTIPQIIGISKTKILGVLIILCNVILLNIFNENDTQFSLNFVIPIIFNTLFLIFVHKNSHRYYSQFWCEAIPIIWLLLIITESK